MGVERAGVLLILSKSHIIEYLVSHMLCGLTWMSFVMGYFAGNTGELRI